MNTMKREILFRGSPTDKNCEWKWIDGSLIVELNGTCTIAHPLKVSLSGFRYVEVIPETVGQFTGLTDKNGTKIFEGDIVSANGWKSNIKYDFSSARKFVSPLIRDSYERVENRTKYEVFWNEYFSQFDFSSIENSSINPSITERELEVIGNIYDNTKSI